MLKSVVPVLALVLVAVVVTAGCSSSEGKDEQRLTAQREAYCTQLGAWQKARNAADTGAETGTETDTPESSGYDEIGAVAENAFLAMRPLRDETVGGGRTLADATTAAMNNSDSDAEGCIVRYCDDAGFETLTR
ncbi:hypothetical protein AB0D14_40110 [Streptomyces sp. NPDC048484]|uniref:hypothetical protein n=1 Tax=Streptomyces sp. NPDC048484 TaxID=3155146 RepID=UPI00343155A2